MRVDGIRLTPPRKVEAISPTPKELPQKKDNPQGGEKKPGDGKEAFAKVLAGRMRAGFHKVL